MSRILLMVLAFVASVIATIGLTDAAQAQKRVALVIGNGAYTKVPRLDNPKNDAAAMEAMFKAAGFDPVVRVNDLGVVAMRRALRDFSDMARDADVAVMFYAGHGIEVGGVNYLIPTDAVLERDIDAPDEAIPLDRINQMLEPVKLLRLVILDACRDNPFARSMRRTIATRSVRSGYGEIDERSLPPNTLVAYAQRAGFTAEDGVGSSNSPFTTALIKHLPTPGLDVELALRRVRDEVLRVTKNRQEPFKYGSLGGAEIALVGENTVQVAASQRLSEAAEAWDRAKDATSIAVLEAYVARFPGTFYSDLARVRIEELRKGQVAGIAPSKIQSGTPKVTIPANTFFKGQTSSQRVTTKTEMIGAVVRASDGTQVGTVEAIIVEGSATVGVLFSHNGKMVGLRTTSANVAIDGRSVTLRTDNAYAILTALDAYQLGPSGIEEQPKRAEGSEAAKKNSERPASEKGGTLVMELTTGPIKIRLRPDLAPKHVERVRLLVKEGFYNGLTFHRVIDKFMAQGGDPSGTGTGGSRHPSLTLEPSEVQFTRGTVAAARTTDPNSANSQFFICFNDYNCKQLSKQYTVWGEVIEGMENVDKLARGEPPAKPDKIISLRITE